MADALTDEMPSAREFTLKKLVDVSESDLRQNAVWASYYEPDDFDTLAALGYDPNACREKLEAIDFADSYVFPLPNSDARRILQISVLRGCSGNKPWSYVTGLPDRARTLLVLW